MKNLEPSIRSFMALKGLTLTTLAEQMGIKERNLWNKLKGLTQFKLNEVVTLREILDIPDEKAIEIFFHNELRGA